MIPFAPVHGGAAAIGTDSTWNPSDAWSTIVLTSSNYVAASSSTRGMVRGMQSRSAGKLYFEIRAVAAASADGSTNNVSVGISPSGEALVEYVGRFASYGWKPAEGIIHNGSHLSSFATVFGATDVFGFAVDFTGLTLGFYRNGLFIVTVPIDAGTYFPAYTPNNPNYPVRLCTGSGSFTYTPPVGYSAWG